MKLKNILPFIGIACISILLFSGFTAPKKPTKPCELTVQYSPTTGDFGFCSVANCNSSSSVTSVTSGTNWIPILPGTGCSTVTITTSLPSTTPGGIIVISKGGTILVTHIVSAGQSATFTDVLKASCDDYFLVNF